MQRGVGTPDPGGTSPTSRPQVPGGGGGVPTCAAVAVLLALAVQQQREHHQQDDQQTGERHHQEEPPLLVEGRLHLSCRATGARLHGQKICPRRDRGGGTPAWSGLSWADPLVSRRRSSGSTVSRAWGPLAPAAPTPGLGQQTYILPVLSVVWVTGREGQKCPALLVSPSMGAFSRDTRKPPGRPCSCCHHLVSPPPPASRTPAESLTSQGVLGWKVGPSCKCCAHGPGCPQSKPVSLTTDPSGPRAGRAHTLPGTSAHTLRLGGLSATCWPPPPHQGFPPTEAGAYAAAGGPVCYLSASAAAPGLPAHGSWGCVLCILCPQQN